MHVKLAENICHHGKRGEGRDKINPQEWVGMPLIPPNPPFPQKQGIFYYQNLHSGNEFKNVMSI